ncbi:hypothetical protein KAI68_01830, partial [bacterium]|nr:hypothetical protein [bacterium]
MLTKFLSKKKKRNFEENKSTKGKKMKKIIVGIGTLWGVLFIFALPLFALDNEEPPEFLLFGKQEKVVTAGKYEQEKAEV